MPRTLLQVKANLPYFANVNEYWNAAPNLAGTIPAGPTGGRRKLWSDPAAARALADRTPPAMVFWGATPPPAANTTPLPEFEYTVLATDAGGRALLTPIESAPSYATWNQSILQVYRERRQFFPMGVPYTVKMRLPAEVAGALNFQATGPEIPVPLDLRQDVLLVPDGQGGVVAYDYAEFMQASRVPEDWTDERRLQEIDAVRRRGGPAADQLAAILDLCTKRGGQVVLT